MGVDHAEEFLLIVDAGEAAAEGAARRGADQGGGHAGEGKGGGVDRRLEIAHAICGVDPAIAVGDRAPGGLRVDGRDIGAVGHGKDRPSALHVAGRQDDQRAAGFIAAVRQQSGDPELILALHADDAGRIDRHRHGVDRIRHIRARDGFLARAKADQFDAVGGEAGGGGEGRWRIAASDAEARRMREIAFCMSYDPRPEEGDEAAPTHAIIVPAHA